MTSDVSRIGDYIESVTSGEGCSDSLGNKITEDQLDVVHMFVEKFPELLGVYTKPQIWMKLRQSPSFTEPVTWWDRIEDILTGKIHGDLEEMWIAECAAAAKKSPTSELDDREVWHACAFGHLHDREEKGEFSDEACQFLRHMARVADWIGFVQRP